MAVGTCAATLPAVSESASVPNHRFSKSLPVSTKAILKKFINQLVHVENKNEGAPVDVKTKATTTGKHAAAANRGNSPSSLIRFASSPKFMPRSSKSRQRTFDLLALVPASPKRVPAPPPSPAVRAVRKRSVPRPPEKKQSPFQNLNPEELEMDFYLYETDSDEKVNESIFDEKLNDDIFDENVLDEIEGSFYPMDSQIEKNSSKITDDEKAENGRMVNNNNLLQVPEVFSYLGPPLPAEGLPMVSQSLGPQVYPITPFDPEYAADAFELAREIEFGPWISQTDGSSWSDNAARLSSSTERDSIPASIREPSGWRKLRSMVQWTPFVQTFKNRRYQWVQLAGHSGNFKAGKNQGTVLKKLCPQEEHCYKQFHNDALSPYVPEYQGTLIIDDEKFIQLQDCLSSFNLPSIMDCKIGVRTYLEEELAKAKEKPKLRKDMYEKMIAVDHSAPTEEEHRLKGVTKPRYMVWRETISSTATLGFRIEGVKKNDGTSSKEFKTTKTKEQILESFRNFISGSAETAKQYLERLITIRHALDGSEFFRTHELIGSSLLFVHDNCKSNIWLIDFGKTVPVPENTHIDHKSPWEVGNHEDGYLIGIQNLIALYSELVIVLEKEALDHLHAKRIPIES